MLGSPTAHAAVPGLSSTSPALRATGVALDANIVLTFSEAVSAESGQIVIYKTSDKSVHESIRVSDSSKVSLSGAVVTINPAANFAYNTNYYVLVDTTAFASVATDDLFGGIQSEGTLNFTTASAPTTTTTSTTVAPTTTVAPLPKLGGTSCKVEGRTRKVGGTNFVCKKTIKLVWRRA
jgi:methionine-rich copper-binding protein CopC